MAVNEKPILGPLASLQERAAAAKTLPCCAFSQPGVNIAAVNLEWDKHRCLTGRLLRQEGDVSPGSPAGNGGAFQSPKPTPHCKSVHSIKDRLKVRGYKRTCAGAKMADHV
jgi:hypothetical protein